MKNVRLIAIVITSMALHVSTCTDVYCLRTLAFRDRNDNDSVSENRGSVPRRHIPGIEVIPLGGVEDTGGSSYYVKIGHSRFLLDAGQGIEGQPLVPRYDLIKEGVDFVIITHPHIDHVGSVIEVVERFGDIPIYTNEPTARIMEIQLNERLTIQKHAAHLGVTLRHAGQIVERVMQNVKVVNMEDCNQVAEEIKLVFVHSGHLVESSAIMIASPYGNMMNTGDMSTEGARTAPSLEYPYFPIHLMLSEATYGGRLHELEREQYEDQLMEVVERVIKRGGVVLVPAFAIGRAGEVALTISHHRHNNMGLRGKFWIYIDGTARHVMEIEREYAEWMPEQTKLRLRYFFTRTSGMRRVYGNRLRSRIVKSPCCIIASSGMMIEGTRSSQHAKKLLPNPKNAIIFVGHLAEDSPAKRLLECKKGDTFNIGGEDIKVLAERHHIKFSAHADHKGIVNFIEAVNPEKVVLGHGDEDAKDDIFTDLSEHRRVDGTIHRPKVGDTVKVQLADQRECNETFQDLKVDNMFSIQTWPTGVPSPEDLNRASETALLASQI